MEPFQDQICEKALELGFIPISIEIRKEPYNGWKVKPVFNDEIAEQKAKVLQQWVNEMELVLIEKL